MAKQKSNANKPTTPTTPQTPQKKSTSSGEEQIATKLSKLESERKQLLVQIAQIKKTITNHDKADSGELQKIVELEKTRKKNVKEYHEISQKIAKLKREEFDLLKKTEKIEKDQTKKLKDDEKGYKNIRDYNKELEGIQEKSVSLMRSMSAETQNQSKLMGLTVSNTKALADEIKDANLRSTKSVSINQSFAKTMEGTINIAKELDSMESRVAEGIDNLGEKEYEMIDLYTMERDLKQQIALVDMNAEKMGAKRTSIQKNVLQSYSAQLQRVKAINKSVAQQSQEMYRTKQSAVDTEKAMAGIAAAVPAGGLYKKMEMEKTEKSSRSISDRLGSLKDKIKGAFEFTFNAISGIFSFAVSVVKFFFSMALELDKTMAKIGTTLNITRDQAGKVTQQFADMAMKINLVGVNWEQFLETTKELSDNYGIDPMRLVDSKEAIKVVENMTILREKFQLTNEESQKFFELSVMHGESMDGMVMRVDKMSKGIMNSRTALKALAAVPKSIQVNMKNSLNDLLKFAIKAKMLGMEMDQFKSTGDFLMDIEASLEKQMEAQAVTGVYIKDMDEIRMAFYTGEADKALDLLDRSMGSLSEFRNMDGGIIGKKLFAQQFGLDVEELIKMLTRKDALKQLGLSMKQAAELERKNAKELFEMSKQASLMGKKGLAEYTKKLALEKQNADLTQRYEDYMTKIRMKLIQTSLPILEKLHKMFDTIVASGMVERFTAFITKFGGSIANMIADGLDWVIGILKEMIKQYEIFKKDGKGFGDMVSAAFKSIVNTISKLLGSGNIFPIDDVKKMGKETDNTKKSVDGMNASLDKTGFNMSEIIKTGLNAWLKELWDNNKGMIMLAGGLLALYKIFTLMSKGGKSGGTGMIMSLLGIAGAVWILADASEKLKKSGLVGAGAAVGIGAGLFLFVKGMGAVGDAATKSSTGIAVFLGIVYALAYALKIIGEASETYSVSFYRMIKAYELVQTLDWAKINKAGDAISEFSKKMWHVMDLFMNSLRESFSEMIGGRSPFQKFIDFINSVNMNRIMAFSGTMKHLAKGLKEAADGLKGMDSTKIDLLWSLGKALDSVGKGLSKSMNDSGGGKLVALFSVLHALDSTKIVTVSNSIFYMAQSFEAVANALNRIDVSKLGKVSLKMQNQQENKDTSIWGSIARFGSAALNKVRSFVGGGDGESNRPVVTVPQPTFSPMYQNQKGNVQQTQNINFNTSALEKKLDTMITLLNALSTQKAQIRFGEKFIDEISVQLNARRDLDMHIHNSAGRTIKG